MLDHKACCQIQFDSIQPLWHNQVAYLACDKAVMTIHDCRIIAPEQALAKAVDLGNTQINIFCHMGMVTLLHSSQFQALCIFVTIFHSTWHSAVCKQQLTQAEDFQVVGHCGRVMTSTKGVMASLKCSPFCSSQEMGRHPQVQWVCHQDLEVTLWSISQHLSAQFLHLDMLMVSLEDFPLAFQCQGSSCQWKCREQISQGLCTGSDCCRYGTTNMMQILRVTICQTWAVQRPNPQLACSKLNSPGSNLWKGWGRPTRMHSTSGRKNGLLGFLRKRICLLSGGRTVWISFVMYSSTGRQWLEIFWRHSRTGCHLVISKILNRFGSSG